MSNQIRKVKEIQNIKDFIKSRSSYKSKISIIQLEKPFELSSGNIEEAKFIGKDDHVELGQNCKALGLHQSRPWSLDSKDLTIEDVKNDTTWICGQQHMKMKDMPEDSAKRRAFFDTMKLNGGPILCKFSTYKVTGIVIDQRIILRGDQLSSGLHSVSPRFFDGPIIEGMIEGTKLLMKSSFSWFRSSGSIRIIVNNIFLFITFIIQMLK